MPKNKIAIIYVFILFIFQCSYAQNASVKGNIDVGGKPIIDTVAVLLFNAQNGVMEKTVFNESKGHFEFNNIKPGIYIIAIDEIKYQTFKSELITIKDSSGTVEIKTINLIPIDNISVTAKPQLVIRKIDRVIVNTESMLAAAGSSAWDLLDKIPGVTTSVDGNIRIKGKTGAMVLVDERNMKLGGAQLENFLRSIPANLVAQIELITNPPARYDAAGGAGVINIILKKNRKPGILGTYSIGVNQGFYTRINNSLNLSYNNKKHSIYLTASQNLRNNFQDLYINRYYNNYSQSAYSSGFSQNSYIRKKGMGFNFRIGYDYAISQKTVIGTILSYNISPLSAITKNKGKQFDTFNTIFNKIVATNDEAHSNNNALANINLRHSYAKPGKTLTFDADYLNYSLGNNQTFTNNFYNSKDSLTSNSELLGNLPCSINVFAGKWDFSNPLKNNAMLEFGMKYSNTKTNNLADYKNKISNGYIPNYALSNEFLYNEYIGAAYINVKQENPKFSWQLGLRNEYTNYAGNQKGNPLQQGSKFNYNYYSFFPTAYIMFPIDSAGKHIISMDYGRRISRPDFLSLNPFVSPMDKFTYYSGNPFLKPSFVNTVSITHTGWGLVSSGFQFSYADNEINETLEIVNGIYYSRPGNLTKNWIANVFSQAGFPVTKKWMCNAYIEAGKNNYKSKLYKGELNTGGYYAVIQLNQQITLPKKWTLEISGDYQSHFYAAQVTTAPTGGLNLAVQKKLFKNKASLKIAITDIFYTRVHNGVINNLENTKADYNSKLDTRAIAFNFSYNFGSGNKINKYNGKGSEQEQNRIKA